MPKWNNVLVELISILSFTGASPVARIEELKSIEQEVVLILESAGLAMQEMGKDRASQKAIDTHNQQVRTTIKSFNALAILGQNFGFGLYLP